MSAEQERLLDPPRLEHYCPGEHCSAICNAETCTCAPCRPSCTFCRDRKAAGRARLHRTPRRFEVKPDFSHRQPRLFGGIERSSK